MEHWKQQQEVVEVVGEIVEEMEGVIILRHHGQPRLYCTNIDDKIPKDPVLVEPRQIHHAYGVVKQYRCCSNQRRQCMELPTRMKKTRQT